MPTQEPLNNPDLLSPSAVAGYTEEDFRTLSWSEHIRKRPGMYIGKIGDGTQADDGIYILIKEVIDNSIDEFVMGVGSEIRITIDSETNEVQIRDYGRGIPLGKLVDATSKMNTGAKIDSQAFKKSVGLNGVGLKAVNALSSTFTVQSWREGETSSVTYERAEMVAHTPAAPCEDKGVHGTLVSFTPDAEVFRNSHYDLRHVEALVRNYCYLNTGLTLYLNDKKYVSRHGLQDFLSDTITGDPLYPIIRLTGPDIEVAITHIEQYGEEFYSFVNGQYTTQGGTHLTAFREQVARVIKEFSGKGFEYGDIRSGMAAAISIRIIEPEFESQTKIKLGSKEMVPQDPMFEHEPLRGVTVQKFVGDFLKEKLDNYLHMHPDISEVMLQTIQANERERKAMSGVTKLARERAKKASLHNKKLRDCTEHYNDPKAKNPELTSIFITEGNSASGSITQSRDARYQAVFSLRGKPLNSYGLSKKVVYENEEFNLLQAALNIEDGLEGLRYNRVIIATDADDDGMHIRLLTLTFFLQFFPELVRRGHVYILETPLYRVSLPAKRKKSITARVASAGKKKGGKKATSEPASETETSAYCYSDQELNAAVERMGASAQITRFKGLGEISANEFKELITEENIKLRQVSLRKEDNLKRMLHFYMGKNTPDRQDFIIDNLIIDEEIV